MKKFISAVLILILLAVWPLGVSAADTAPTDTFTRWTLANGSTRTVVMRPIYEAVEKINARSLGLSEEFGQIVQVKFDRDGNVYILTGSSEIIVLDSDYNYLRSCVMVGSDGEPVDFDGASGFHIESSDVIYIADTNHARVLKCVDGTVTQEIFVPESALIPSDFTFQPIKVAKDRKGYLYVLSAGSYYGVVLYDPAGEFVGFYGANTVKGTILTTLQYIWDTFTKNDIKRSKEIKKLPYQITDICLDDSDFVYTCTSKNAGGSVGQIRMLSPGGSNILTGAEDRNFGETERVKRRGQNITQNFTGIVADGQGFIYALDSSYGFIYVYDTKSNLIGVFGGGIGNGRQVGTFSSAFSIAVSGSVLLVSDSIDNSITVFRRTEYGEMVFSAQQLSLRSDYIAAEPLWQRVYKLDEYNRLALVGLAKAAYDSGDYHASMHYAKAAFDGDTYSLALKQVQNAFITAHWTWIFLAVMLLIAALTVLLIYSVKHRVVLIKNEKLHIMACAMFHPFRSFSDIKYKNKGSIWIAIVLTALYFVTGVTAVIMSDFRYTAFDASTYNAVLQLVKTAGLILLWTVANWAVSILLQGRGRLKEVFVAASYAMLPMILYHLVSTPLTYLLTSSGSTLISGLNTLAVILSGIMLCVGHMTIHDFSFPRVLASFALTVVFMILIVFVLFMIGILLSQFWSFAVSIFLEAVRWR